MFAISHLEVAIFTLENVIRPGWEALQIRMAQILHTTMHSDFALLEEELVAVECWRLEVKHPVLYYCT